MEDSDYVRIPERLRIWTCFWGLDHYIWVGTWLDGVAVPSHVICCIVYLQCLTAKDLFASDKDSVPIFIRERAVSVTLIFLIKEMT